MPEQLKALIVILGLAALVFAFAKRPACAVAIAESDFARRRNLWIATTLTVFLAHNFWVYMVVTGVLLWLAAKQESNKLGLYFFLLLAVPPIADEITGLGVIRYFFAIDYLRLLSLVVLLPAAFFLRSRRTFEGGRAGRADLIIAAYIILNLLLQLGVDTFTNTLRHAFYLFLDMVLPYYVASRSLRNLDGFRDALMSFALAAILVASVGVFEFARHWLLYAPLKEALGVPWGYGNYLEREDSLRALASTGQPIVMGYVMAAAIGIFLFLQKSVASRAVWGAGVLLLVAGLVATVSRGPWIGAAVVLLVFIVTGPKVLSRLLLLALAGLIALPVLLATAAGEKLLNYLPFIGTVEETTITYRQRLIDVSLDIIAANPWFGSFDFLLYLEEMRQGQGIIDLVNSYLNIALSSGLVGLALFVSFFGVILVGIRKSMRRLGKSDELHLLGRALIATMSGILVTIFTVSSINVIPVIYWSVAGLGVAYIRLAARDSCVSPALAS